jgi:LysR family glycine cleavage system transcriptional activator
MLNAFVAFGREGGVRRAAQYLGVDHAIVSRHLRALEDYVGTTLVDRSGGGHRLTSEGQVYHARVAGALRDIADATNALRGRDRRNLVVWCVPGFAYNWLRHRLSQFNELHPDIELELRPSDRVPDFAASEADADVRYIRLGAESLIPSGVRRLEIARPIVFPVISPELAAEISNRLKTPADLLKERLLHEEDDHEWRMWFRAQYVNVMIDRIPGQRLWHAHHTLDAAREGQGIALANPLLLGRDLEENYLVPLNINGEPAKAFVLGGYNILGREDRWNSVAFSKMRKWILGAMPA